MDLFDVSGKNALVTGGGRGIGLMIARGLVQAGVHVAIASRKAEDLETAASELRAVGECEAIPADLSTPEGAGALAEVARIVPLGRIGRPDDAAGLTVFLASRAGSYLTGAVIPLDGGITGCG